MCERLLFQVLILKGEHADRRVRHQTLADPGRYVGICERKAAHDQEDVRLVEEASEPVEERRVGCLCRLLVFEMLREDAVGGVAAGAAGDVAVR